MDFLVTDTFPVGKSNTNVVMQAAEDGPRFDAPEGVNWSPRRRILVQGQVCLAPIVVARITAQQMGRWRSPKTITWSKQSRRIEPIARSQYPFCQGERAAVGRSRMPIARIRLIKASPYTRSRSRNRYFGGFSQPIASVTCCAIHSAVGCAVTPNHMISRRSCRRINRPNRSRNDSVGTTNRSSAAIPSA